MQRGLARRRAVQEGKAKRGFATAWRAGEQGYGTGRQAPANNIVETIDAGWRMR